MTNPLRFGINIDPSTDSIAQAYEYTALADASGIDLITIQDHPYQRRFLDTWTLLSVLAAKTERVHLGTNVINLPLRPPAMLAKQAATLDVLSNGRLELGIGAGAFWQGVAAFGGQARQPREAYEGFKDALHILRGMWANAGKSFSYAGEIYTVKGAQPGPAPTRHIPIWVGASGPKMLRLTGEMADGVLVSNAYEPPKRLLEINRLIDEGAAAAGRSPNLIRRGYNVMGVVAAPGENRPAQLGEGMFFGTSDEWVQILTELHHEYRQDTFILWAIGADARMQYERFAQEIVPALRDTAQA